MQKPKRNQLVQCIRDMSPFNSISICLIISFFLIGMYNVSAGTKFIVLNQSKEKPFPSIIVSKHLMSKDVKVESQTVTTLEVSSSQPIKAASEPTKTAGGEPSSKSDANPTQSAGGEPSSKSDANPTQSAGSKPTNEPKSSSGKSKEKSKNAPQSKNTFSWLKSRNMAHFLLPGEDTSILSPEACDPDTNIRVLGLVMTAPQNFKDREVVRSTWAKQFQERDNVKIVFVMGMYTANTSIPHHTPPLDQYENFIPEEEMITQLIEEYEQYGDIIVEGFLDTYLNLTLKTSFGLKWIEKNCPNADFVLKVDDNVFVHTENLFNYLDSVKMDQDTFVINGKNITMEYSFFGNKWINANSNRHKNSKYYLPKEYYKEKKLPPFLRGMAYVFSGSLIKPLFYCVSHTDYIPGEDVFVSGICGSKRLRLKLNHHKGFWRGPVKVGGTKTCQLNNAVAVHDFDYDVMRKIYKTLEDGKTCKNQTETKSTEASNLTKKS